VRLKSGGPDLTVASIDEPSSTSDRTHVWCQWFGGRKLERGRFDLESLEMVNSSEEKKES